MTPSPPQIEAEARRLLATEMSADLRGQVGGNVEAIVDDLIHDPLGWQKIALRAIITALSPQLTSQDDAGLCERLRTKRQYMPKLGGGSISADGKVTSYTIDDGMRLINPDGPEAAARIATLSADVARMREALAEYEALNGTCPYAGSKTPPSSRPCLKCGATLHEPCRVLTTAAFNFVSTARATLSGETK